MTDYNPYTLDEFIKELQELRNKHGDFEICCIKSIGSSGECTMNYYNIVLAHHIESYPTHKRGTIIFKEYQPF